ncbi:Uncharacterised protein [Mycobacteroides abscessus subsp. abscessus]|nr:Uncharacterised protein [Mycobacteroides abscessus subsp. abscessus]SKU64584.1 Uncharacterised protein [Mycobacteroides abscessus subsp. abscessus]
MAGSPTAETSATVIAPDRHTAISAAAYARSMRSRYGNATYLGAPGGRSGNSIVFFGPCACNTETPAAARSLAAAETALLRETAPCEPPNTNSTRASSSNP